MKFMRLAACAVAFAVVGGMVYAEDMDIKALQAKLAAQEARLNDLQAKMGSGSAATPANIMSVKKNAKVTIGGVVDTRYVYDSIRTETSADVQGDLWGDGGEFIPLGDPAHDYTVAADHANNFVLNSQYQVHDHYVKTRDRKGDLFIDGAKLEATIEVNENFDAYIVINTKDHTADTGIAEKAWIRWKNICGSGWGILIGRDGLKFGMGNPAGMFDNWLQDNGSRTIYNQDSAPHLNYGVGRITQINPYWVSQDGKFRFDLSLFQTVEASGAGSGTAWQQRADGIHTVNYGLGSGTMKLEWKPTEDWTFVGAIAHFYADGDDGDAIRPRLNDGGVPVQNWGAANSNSNTAIHLGAIYNPAAFCKKLTLWAQGTKEWNGGFVDGADFFALNAGVAYAFSDKITGYARGDLVRFDADEFARPGEGYKLSGWRSDIGLRYNFASGADFMLGWAHEDVKRKSDGFTFQKAKGDTIYSRVAFSF